MRLTSRTEQSPGAPETRHHSTRERKEHCRRRRRNRSGDSGNGGDFRRLGWLDGAAAGERAPPRLYGIGVAYSGPPCVCRHWRQVCNEMEEKDKAVAAAVTCTSVATAVAEAEAAAAAAAAAGATRGVLGAAGGITGGAAAAAAAAAATSDGGNAAAAAAVEGSSAAGHAAGGGDGCGRIRDGQHGVAGGLWGCLDLRSRPSVRFDDQVVQGGLISRRWSQVQTLRLRTCPGLTRDGFTRLCGGCLGLTSLELTQCDSLVKLDTMRVVLASLPRLRHLDLSHNQEGVMDNVIKLALAPRRISTSPPSAPQQQQQRQQAAEGEGGRAAADGGAGGSGGLPDPAGGASGGSRGSGTVPWALPCPLRVLHTYKQYVAVKGVMLIRGHSPGLRL
ncbi:hypothetical protein VOLCADRAFT_90674 [Volvox carteri f. nagariensis]|uniref:F-box domain-containing protein n=1 Tax=Volvox carteri f. nagariensis TaxID=3068 RepID=D8TVF0_VOLCA|nr:uncharacterized protein VOLCADRAFT_90674 [Volvox carteri f. nagariensis]EFJ48448.1 hypothetical protein VOLCADRAFT_90674 [Volvox carteri f. nagariensis]|eukprot:XP_002950247.1 hypothetical protein VOLCADRAFT_90674 [Volvox carteri f. nagariensis]